MSKHKHYDVIVAWAEGKAIEGRDKYTGYEWVDIYTAPVVEDREYRIKPEPKPDVVYYNNVYDNYISCSRNSLGDSFVCSAKEDLLGVLKLTYDGKTGKLKSAEVLDV
jgi:hypothetical protein